MASSLHIADLDLALSSQITNARKHNVTIAQMASLAQILTMANVGLFVWNSDLAMEFTWDGQKFINPLGTTSAEAYTTLSEILGDLPGTTLVDPLAYYILAKIN